MAQSVSGTYIPDETSMVMLTDLQNKSNTLRLHSFCSVYCLLCEAVATGKRRKKNLIQTTDRAIYLFPW